MTERDHRSDEFGELVRSVAPRVLANLVRRGEEFAAAEDALQEAIVDALRVWPERRPDNPVAWLTRVALNRLVDARRSASARRAREDANVMADPGVGPTELGDDTLLLLFMCCHPDLSPASQVALTLRAVGGLSTREIADAFFVPEATMAQRISRAKRAMQSGGRGDLSDVALVLRVLSLIYHAGHSGDAGDGGRSGHGGRHGLADEAIRLTRQLTLAIPEPEARGLLALMLVQHARLPARVDALGRVVTLDEQDRSLWDTAEIAEGVTILQGALAAGQPGRFQIQAAIAALHADAATADETDWPQILAWYDDLIALAIEPARDDPAAVLSRAVAVGHVDGWQHGLDETERVRSVLGDRDQWHAVRAYLFEHDGQFAAAADEYASAARLTRSVADREHLVRRAARARASRAFAGDEDAAAGLLAHEATGATARAAADAGQPPVGREAE